MQRARELYELASSLEEVGASIYFVLAQFEIRLFLFWKLNAGVIYIGVEYIICAERILWQ